MRDCGTLARSGRLLLAVLIGCGLLAGPAQAERITAAGGTVLAVLQAALFLAAAPLARYVPLTVLGAVLLTALPETLRFEMKVVSQVLPFRVNEYVINELIVKSVSDLGATAVSITHDMASARKIGHRIGMLYEGRLIWQGPVSDIDRSGNAHVDQFIHGRAEGPIQMQVRKL